ncbi:MAG: TetR/AcrR family transcriptional regulator [Peptococcaceae bacterium]|nr:TetR/AcrR family transcriptional regulator [Peptococcaceae bacterium]
MNTRDKLILVCEEIAIKKGRGFYNLSMEELAMEAGISKRTIYRHFDSKEKLIEMTIQEIMNKIMAKNMELADSEKDIEEIIVGVLKNAAYLVNQQVILDLGKHYPLLWQKIDKMRQSKIEFLITTIFSNSKVKLRWRVDPGIFRASFLAAMTAVLNPSFIWENGLTFEEAGKSFLNMFLFGAVERVEEE